MPKAASAAILLIIAFEAEAFRPRPVSGLRFENFAAPTWNRGVASDGTDFLVLSAHWYPSRDGVFVQKVSSSGAPVGPRRHIGYGISVAGLTWTGSHYLAGWHLDHRELWTAPLSRDGSLLAPPVRSMVSATFPLLAANATSALAFAYDDDEVTVQPLDLTGRPTAAATTYTAPAPRGGMNVAALDGNRFAAVFSGRDGTWLMLFDADGAQIGSAILIDGPYATAGSNYRSNAALAASDGSDVLVVFGAGHSDIRGELVTAVVGPDGAVKSKQVIHSMPRGGPSSMIPVALRWDGSQYLVLANIIPAPLESSYDPALLRVTRAGALGGEVSWVSRDQEQDDRGTALASNGRELLATTAYAAIAVDAATLRPRTPIELNRTLTAQSGLTIEAGYGGYLAAWYETDAEGTTVRASRIDAAGNYLDGDGIVLDTVGPRSPYWERAIAIDGHGPHWFVVWSPGTDRNQIAGRTVSWSGVAGAAVMPIGSGYGVDVLWRGSQYAVLRIDYDLHLDLLRSDGTVTATRVVRKGDALDTPIGTSGLYFIDPHLVLLRDRLLAMYSARSTCSGYPGCGARTSLSGLWLDDADAEPFVVDNDVWGLHGIAAAGDRALVVWASSENLYGAFLSADMPVAAGARFHIESYGRAETTVAHDGTHFWVAHHDTWPSESIVARRIASDGTVLERAATRLDDGEFTRGGTIAANATMPALLAFDLHHSAYDSVSRGALLFASELAEAAAPPPAPAIVCATENADGTITVSWQQAPNALGHSIELQLADGAFRQIGVAAASASSARVSRAGLPGSVVRVRAWNERGLSLPSAIAPTLPAPRATLRSGTWACAGKPVTIAYSLSGAAPFTVRWSDGVVQTNVQAAATRVVTLRRDTTLSIVSVSDASCAIGDDTHSIRVLVDPVAAIDEQPRELRIARGQTATLTVRADDDLTFAWFEGDPGDTSRPVGRNEPSFTTPVLHATARYWVRVSNRCGSVDSGAMVVVVASGKGRAVRR